MIIHTHGDFTFLVGARFRGGKIRNRASYERVRDIYTSNYIANGHFTLVTDTDSAIVEWRRVYYERCVETQKMLFNSDELFDLCRKTTIDYRWPSITAEWMTTTEYAIWL